MPSVWYFAYGSNMDPARLITARLQPAGIACSERVLGRLEGWSLVFDKPSAYFPGASAANIAFTAGAHVLGTLNRMPEAGLDVLDYYENVATGHYERMAVTVHRPGVGDKVDAVTYVARNFLDGALKPRAVYLAHLLAGSDLLPAPYVERLRAVDVFEGR
ncbi:gamma-glutamylcyclotransferase [Labrys miyagiensis]|nr:gamma-glutamylcyclotransferase [Labrys miyagiensis]